MLDAQRWRFKRQHFADQRRGDDFGAIRTRTMSRGPDGSLAQVVRHHAAMRTWIVKCIKVVGFIALATVILALGIVVGTGITALSTQWDEFEQRAE